VRLIIRVLLFTLFATAAVNAQTADYKDQQELATAILGLNGAMDGRVQVRRYNRSEEGRPLHVVTISDGFAGKKRNLEPKPGFLIECGMHAREWGSAEVCFNFLEDFIATYESGKKDQVLELREILSKVDLYVIPLVNPDGRAFDDPAGGDPFTYHTATHSAGWRPNRSQFVCASTGVNTVGIDLARNFSVGWETIPQFNNNGAQNGEWTCGHRKYRGNKPFDAKENRFLRRFVNNHLIGQSISVHSFGATFGTPLPSGNRKIAFIDTYNSAASDSRLFIDSGINGSGYGQFPAWAATTSDAFGFPDYRTVRGIVSYLLELPPDLPQQSGSSVPNDDYSTYGTDYRVDPTRSQSPFRPTGQQFLDDMRAPIYASFLYLARQARSPWLDIDPMTHKPVACGSPCPQDLALVGSKIVRAVKVGRGIRPLSNTPIMRMARNPEPLEWVNEGGFIAQVGVQNSSMGNSVLTGDVRFTVEETDASGNTITLSPSSNRTQRVSLSPGEIAFLASSGYEAKAGQSYAVYIEIMTADSQPLNNRHVFRFEAR